MAIANKMAMIRTTTMSSMRVKPSSFASDVLSACVAFGYFLWFAGLGYEPLSRHGPDRHCRSWIPRQADWPPVALTGKPGSAFHLTVNRLSQEHRSWYP